MIRPKSETPLVTVIIAGISRPQALREALASVLEQRYHPLEVIVAEDAGAQHAKPVVESFNDPRLRFYRNASPLGMVANCLRAVRMARGKYIAMLHDEDTWLPEFLSRLVPTLEANPCAAVAFSDHYLVDGNGRIDLAATAENTVRYRRHALHEGVHMPFIKLAVLDQAIPAGVSAVFRKDAIVWEKLPVQANHTRDLYLAYLACRQGRGAYYVPERLACHPLHPAQAARHPFSIPQSFVYTYEIFLRDDNLRAFRNALQNQLLHYREELGWTLLRAGHAYQARKILLAALKIGRWQGRAWAGLVCTAAPRRLNAALLRYREHHRQAVVLPVIENPQP